MNPYNTDPRVPEHIVGMCLAIANGEDCRGPLHDALLEEGLEICAKSVLTAKIGQLPNYHWTESYTVGLMLNDGYHYSETEPATEEFYSYLEKRGKRVPQMEP